MKLSERLTMAGLVFILLGTTAALLPEDGLALACSSGCPNPHCVYELRAGNSVSLTNGQTYRFPNNCSPSICFTAYESCNGGQYTRVNITSFQQTLYCGSVYVTRSGSNIQFQVTRRPLSAAYLITFSDGGTETIYLQA